MPIDETTRNEDKAIKAVKIIENITIVATHAALVCIAAGLAAKTFTEQSNPLTTPGAFIGMGSLLLASCTTSSATIATKKICGVTPVSDCNKTMDMLATIYASLGFLIYAILGSKIDPKYIVPFALFIFSGVFKMAISIKTCVEGGKAVKTHTEGGVAKIIASGFSAADAIGITAVATGAIQEINKLPPTAAKTVAILGATAIACGATYDTFKLAKSIWNTWCTHFGNSEYRQAQDGAPADAPMDVLSTT